MGSLNASEMTFSVTYANDAETPKQRAKNLRKEAKQKLKAAREQERISATQKAERKAREKQARKAARRIEACRARLERIVKDGSDADAIAAAKELLNS